MKTFRLEIREGRYGTLGQPFKGSPAEPGMSRRNVMGRSSSWLRTLQHFNHCFNRGFLLGKKLGFSIFTKHHK